MNAVASDVAFNWADPDYDAVFAERASRLALMRSTPGGVEAMRKYYAEAPAEFISDLGVCYEPRNAERGLPTSVPFLLFPRQVEWVDWVVNLWRNGLPGITEKSRDCGISTLAMALSVWMCVFNQGIAVGVGSRKEDLVDAGFNPDALLFKCRYFIQHLPPEFRAGFDPQKHSAHLRLHFPATGSSITGEAGDAIGRGGRKSIYWVDESAHLERPRLIEASLASTTNCRQDISSVAGRGNPFAERRFSGKIDTFTFSWRDDPRKAPGTGWYEKQVQTLDPVTLAQEVNLDYAASVSGSLIPSVWIQSAVDAHIKLGLSPSGARVAGLDVADEGIDLNAIACRHGICLQHLESWSGKGGDLMATAVKAVGVCDDWGIRHLEYDADGLGSGVRGDIRILNEQRIGAGKETILDNAYRGSASPCDPESELVPGRKNKDFFSNLKAMSWWSLRQRFELTHRAVTTGTVEDPDALISIDGDLQELSALLSELSQPTYQLSLAGKVVINKTPAGTKSPNLADAVCIAFNPASAAQSLQIWIKLGEG